LGKKVNITKIQYSDFQKYILLFRFSEISALFRKKYALLPGSSNRILKSLKWKNSSAPFEMRLKDKVALITGAGSGFGRASSILFSREGAKIAVVDIDRTSGEETVALIKEKGGDAFFLKVDVSIVEDVESMVNETVRRYGRIDILFNNAGINPLGSVVDTSVEIWNRTIDVNLKGVFLCMKYTIPFMERQGGGSIVNTASINGLVGLYNEAAYDASKGGVVLITKATALDFGSKNIRVNCICPGVSDTPLMRKYVEGSADPGRALKEMGDMNVAIKRLIRPEEVAYTALFLASDESSGVTGSAYTVDGGYTAI